MEGAGRVRIPGALRPRVRKTRANSEESPGFLKNASFLKPQATSIVAGTISGLQFTSQEVFQTLQCFPGNDLSRPANFKKLVAGP
jgi:hypothetical protein